LSSNIVLHTVFHIILLLSSILFSPSCEEMGPKEDRIRILERQLAAEKAKRVIAETKLAKTQAQKSFVATFIGASVVDDTLAI
jgi:hypothetical protein